MSRVLHVLGLSGGGSSPPRGGLSWNDLEGSLHQPLLWSPFIVFPTEGQGWSATECGTQRLLPSLLGSLICHSLLMEQADNSLHKTRSIFAASNLHGRQAPDTGFNFYNSWHDAGLALRLLHAAMSVCVGAVGVVVVVWCVGVAG